MFNKQKTVFFSRILNVCYSMILFFGGWGGGAAVLKLGCTANFDLLFLVMGFVSLVDEIQVTVWSLPVAIIA